MVQRKAERPKQAPARSKPAMAAVARAEPQGIDAWKQECERLRIELKMARAEVVQLRSQHEQVLNRIDWLLDSLDTLAESDG